MSTPAEVQPSTAFLAAKWFARRRSGEMTAEEAQALETWLSEDTPHRQAFRNLQVAWRDVETMRDDPAIMALRHEAMRPGLGIFRSVAGRALAACLVVLVLAGIGVLGSAAIWNAKRFSDQEYRTGVGQRATVTLADGSVMTLNTNSVVRTRASKDRRLIYLDRGQAFFKVAKDRRHPFIVAAAGRTVTAIGTAFDVRVDDGRMFQVTLVEGKVRVEAAPAGAAPAAAGAPPVKTTPAKSRVQATEMIAGTQLTAADATSWDLTRADVQRETSWVQGQLIFYSEPLSKVVAELNRYSDRKVVLDDETYAQRPISGTFKVGDVDTFVRGLETYKLARVEAETSQTITLAAP